MSYAIYMYETTDATVGTHPVTLLMADRTRGANGGHHYRYQIISGRKDMGNGDIVTPLLLAYGNNL